MTGRLPFRIHGPATLADLFGDAVAYRLLEPVDPRIPGLGELRQPLGLGPNALPRKSESDYGRVVAEVLVGGARALHGGSSIDNVVVVGDTELNDGGAFENTCLALECPGAAFICTETADPPRLEREDLGSGRLLFRANRWNLIDDFDAQLEASGVDVGPGTAVLVDIDKTALGARGRNHRPIDDARVAAVMRTASELRGDELDGDRLMAAYDRFNTPRFHPFTSDNQDYLAYIAMLVESGWIGAEDLEVRVAFGDIVSFDDLLAAVGADSDRLPFGFRQAHDEVVRASTAGDPTPFKSFRIAEYVETVARMKPVEDPDAHDDLLEMRLTITAEVWNAARRWREQGALLFALSDKPDEASTPAPELAAEGYLPLHRTEALVVGEDSESGSG